MVVARASEHDEREQLAGALESLGFWWPSARAETFQLAILAVALATAANHGLDLLSGGSLGLREASIPFSCLSNAIICDLRKRTSSIRRSSLISITLGLLTVIGGYLSVAFLEEAAGQASNAHLSPAFAHV